MNYWSRSSIYPDLRASHGRVIGKGRFVQNASCGAGRALFDRFMAAERCSIRRVLVSRFWGRRRLTGVSGPEPGRSLVVPGRSSRGRPTASRSPDDGGGMSGSPPSLRRRPPETLGIQAALAKFCPWIDRSVVGAGYLGRRVRCRSELRTHGGPSRRDTEGRRTDHQQRPVSQQRCLTSERMTRRVGDRAAPPWRVAWPGLCGKG